MSQFEKLIARIFSNTSVSYSEAEKILIYLGYQLRVTGSHHIFRKQGCRTLSIKRRVELYTYQIDELREVLKKHGYTE